MINKETHQFKFNGLSWKLIAKIDSNTKDLLIYIRNIIDEKPEQNKISDDNIIKLEIDNSVVFTNKKNNINIQEIVSFYYQLTYGDENKSPIIIKSINNDSEDQILIDKISNDIWTKYNNKEIDFTIYLNIDNIYSTILMYMSENIIKILESNEISYLNKEDLISIIKKLPKISENQEFGLILALKWGKTKIIIYFLFIFFKV